MENKAAIQKALGLDDYQYGDFVYQHGLHWITNYFLGDDRLQHLIAGSAPFWAWWKSQWAIRDEQFIHEAGLTRINERLTGHTLMMARALYEELHNVAKLYIIPNRTVKNEIARILYSEIKKENEKIKHLQHGK